MKTRVLAVAKSLSQSEQMAARLRLEGLRVPEIARSMGQDEATVRRWLTKVQGLMTAEARAEERSTAERRGATVDAEAPGVAARWELPPEWEARLAAVAGRGAVRRVRGVVNADELMVIVLRMEGLREVDVAKRLGQRPGTVNTRLVRVRKRLAVEAPELAERLWTRKAGR